MSVYRISVILVCLLACMAAQAQQQDLSGLTGEEFLDALRDFRNPAVPGGIMTSALQSRCRLDLTFEIIRRQETMSGAELALLQQAILPPVYEKELASPSRRFVIRYDTTAQNVNTPALLDAVGDRIEGTYDEYARQTAIFCDSSYMFYVDQLGYNPPPGLPYQVYVSELGAGSYGATFPYGPKLNPSDPIPRYATYLIIDNDFKGYYSPGLDGVRITVAHEFHHAIQIGAYGSRGSTELYFYEMTSTHYEDAVFPWVNDYYQYMFEHFNNPHLAFYTQIGPLVGYQKGIFLKMIDRQYGDGPIRGMWENIRTMGSFPSMDSALRRAGSTLASELCRFGEWCFHTGYRAEFASPAVRYEEGAEFPLVAVAGRAQLTAGEVRFNGLLEPSGNRYYQVYRGQDTVTVILTNRNTKIDLTDPSRIVKADFTLIVTDGQPGPPYMPLSNGWSYAYEGPEVTTLCVNAAVNNVITGITEADIPSGFALLAVYPNPVTAGENVLCLWSIDARRDITLAVYDVQGKQVAALHQGASDAGTYSSVLKTAGLAPGAYFIRMRSGGAERVQSLTIIR